jgi:hypothetical protein
LHGTTSYIFNEKTTLDGQWENDTRWAMGNKTR